MEKCFVYLPVYNGDAFIKETIESVLNQDYPNFQVVVWDDASSDSSEDIICSYVDKYPDKIIFKKNPFNLGVGMTLRKCYEEFHNCRFFAQIGHDDIWPKNYLSCQIKNLEESNAVVSFAANDYINSKGNKRTDISIFEPDNIDEFTREQLFLRILKNNFLCAPASVVDLSKVDPEEATTFWGYNNDRIQDCELWLNLCLEGEFLYNKNVKMHYRVHDNNLSDVNKRVLQGKLEYYTMVHRVLWSSRFLEFVEADDDPEGLIDAVLDTLILNVGYSNPIKLLIIDFCEHFLNFGYNTEKRWSYLNWMYMDSGIITKCLKNNKKLTAPIELCLGGSIKSKKTVLSLTQSGNFVINGDVGAINPHCICVTQLENMEFLFNHQAFYYNFMHGQVVLFCERNKVKECKKEYPNLLVVEENISPQQLEKKLYQFVEDHTHIYRNGFFDMITGYGYPDYGYEKIVVEIEKNTSVREVFIPGRETDKFTFSADGTMIEQIENDKYFCLLAPNTIENGRLTICSDNGIGLKDRVIINNMLYICAEVDVTETFEYTPIFRQLSYYNAGHSLIYPNNDEVMANYGELNNITNSLTYKAALKIKNALAKMHILGFAKKITKGILKE